METGKLNQDTTEFQSGDVLEFGRSKLPTKQEIEAAKLQELAKAAYKTVQIKQLENHNLISMPQDPLQLATVVSLRHMQQNRNAELELDREVDFWREAA